MKLISSLTLLLAIASVEAKKKKNRGDDPPENCPMPEFRLAETFDMNAFLGDWKVVKHQTPNFFSFDSDLCLMHRWTKTNESSVYKFAKDYRVGSPSTKPEYETSHLAGVMETSKIQMYLGDDKKFDVSLPYWILGTSEIKDGKYEAAIVVGGAPMAEEAGLCFANGQSNKENIPTHNIGSGLWLLLRHGASLDWIPKMEAIAASKKVFLGGSYKAVDHNNCKYEGSFPETPATATSTQDATASPTNSDAADTFGNWGNWGADSSNGFNAIPSPGELTSGAPSAAQPTNDPNVIAGYNVNYDYFNPGNSQDAAYGYEQPQGAYGNPQAYGQPEGGQLRKRSDDVFAMYYPDAHLEQDRMRNTPHPLYNSPAGRSNEDYPGMNAETSSVTSTIEPTSTQGSHDTTVHPQVTNEAGHLYKRQWDYYDHFSNGFTTKTETRTVTVTETKRAQPTEILSGLRVLPPGVRDMPEEEEAGDDEYMNYEDYE